MAQNFASTYSGFWNAATTANPMGVPINESADGAEDGTYFEKQLVAAWTHTIAGPLSAMGLSPDGSADTVGDSQYMRALLSLIIGGAALYTDTGAANAYVLDVTNGEAPASPFDGMRITFSPVNDSTGPSTVVVNGATSRDIVTPDGYNIIDHLKSGRKYTITYDSTNLYWVLETKDDGEETGKLIPFFCDSAPDGFIECQGSLVSRTTYARLWQFAQDSGLLLTETAWQTELTDNDSNSVGYFSEGDGSTTFRLPKIIDFIRFVASGYGTYTADTLAAHTHTIDNAAGTVGTDTGTAQNVASTTSGTTGSTGDDETAPKNIGLIACIKY